MLEKLAQPQHRLNPLLSAKPASALFKEAKERQPDYNSILQMHFKINGRRVDDRKNEYWAFYLNGKMAQIGAGSYQLKNGDKIEWKIETY